MRKISTGAIIAIAVTGLFLTLLTSGLLMSYQTVQSGGTITAVNVGVYSNSGCTVNATYIDWGPLLPGNTTTRTVWVKNIGTANVTLSMTTSNWNPTNANQSITLTWDRSNKLLVPNEVTQATLTLSVASNISSSITTFSFNIIITGTG